MTNYETIENEENVLIKRTDDDGQIWFIPTDPANSDYQRYLRWLNGEEETDTLS